MTPKKILYFSIGPLGGAILGIFSLPIIAWIFNQEDVGKMALLQVVLSFGTLFFTLGLDQSYVREFHNSNNTSLLFKTAILPGLILLIGCLAVCLIFGSFLSEMIFSSKSIFVSWLLAIVLLSNFLSRFFSLILRMTERGLAFSMSQLLPKVFILIIIFSYILFDVNKNFEHLLLANTLAIMLACLIFTWNTRKEWKKSLNYSINIPQLLSMLRFGFPLILGGIAFWGLTSLDRILLKLWSNYNELAVYSISVSFAAAATILQSVFSTVWAPTVYKWASNKEGHDKVIIVSRYVLLLVLLLFCLAGIFSWLIPFILPIAYAPTQKILVACMASPLFYTLSEVTAVGIGVARKSSYSMLASILALCTNLACNYFLIPTLGAAGAAISIMISFWIFLVLRTEFSILVWKPLPRIELYFFTIIVMAGATINALLDTKFI
ncbi:lipopolysaccharide biosynthesis protein, partial [Providencia huaxiensis]|uniref:lipopolysaccharide biosynthesis protein n=3 Tax=Morganellaceae TaxID=1903414 RepID=UPI001EFCAF5B